MRADTRCRCAPVSSGSQRAHARWVGTRAGALSAPHKAKASAASGGLARGSGLPNAAGMPAGPPACRCRHHPFVLSPPLPCLSSSLPVLFWPLRPSLASRGLARLVPRAWRLWPASCRWRAVPSSSGARPASTPPYVSPSRRPPLSPRRRSARGAVPSRPGPSLSCVGSRRRAGRGGRRPCGCRCRGGRARSGWRRRGRRRRASPGAGRGRGRRSRWRSASACPPSCSCRRRARRAGRSPPRRGGAASRSGRSRAARSGWRRPAGRRRRCSARQPSRSVRTRATYRPAVDNSGAKPFVFT